MGKRQPEPRQAAGKLLTAAGLAVIVAAAVLAAYLFTRSRPSDAETVERFKTLCNAGDPAALELLGPAPVFDETPLSEEEAEARQAAHFLRVKPEVLSVRPGEPGKAGEWLKTPGRFTLALKVEGSTPPVRVRTKAGETSPPSSLYLKDPDVVVEVRDGKIHALRSEIHRE